MALRAPYLLPWLPDTGDFAPAWTSHLLGGADASRKPDTWPGATLLLCFVPPGPPSTALLDGLSARAEAINGLGCRLLGFVVERPATGTRFPLLTDEDRAIARAFCLPLAERDGGTPSPRAVLVDADSRIVGATWLTLTDDGAEAVLRLAADHAPFTALRPPHAPILQLPGLFSPALCQQLLATFEQGEPVDGTVMQVKDGKPTHVVDPSFKRRRDLRLTPPLRERIWEQLQWRLWPAVKKAFRFDITRFEYLQIGRYRASDGGHFNPHRDDDHAGNSHRRFALTVNLNAADEYDGGELFFHESGVVVRPAPGGAVLFSCSLLHEARLVTAGERFVLVGMFWGNHEIAQYERNSTALAAATAPDTRSTRTKQMIDSARALRQLAGDVDAFGAFLDGKAAAPVNARKRLDQLHRDVIALREDLAGLRSDYLDAQLAKLDLPPRELKLHLGCGSIRLPGWVNIDSSGGDLAMDLRWRLPFADQSVRYIFASHVLEHLYRYGELPSLLREIRRVLQPGGILRAIVPDIEKCIRAYGHDQRFFDERKKTWAWAKECKTQLDHFLTYAGAGQTLESFAGHKYGYDWDTLVLVLQEAGFSMVERSDFMTSNHEVIAIDTHSHNAAARSHGADGVYYSLFVEATR